MNRQQTCRSEAKAEVRRRRIAAVRIVFHRTYRLRSLKASGGGQSVRRGCRPGPLLEIGLSCILYHVRPEDIRELRDAQPFVPFRVCLTDGKAYDVPSPDFLMISRTVIDSGIASNPAAEIYDRIVRVSPLHIVGVENFRRSRSANKFPPYPSNI